VLEGEIVHRSCGRGRARIEYDTVRRRLRVQLRQVEVNREAIVAAAMV